jgi:hypothetical protein
MTNKSETTDECGLSLRANKHVKTSEIFHDVNVSPPWIPTNKSSFMTMRKQKIAQSISSILLQPCQSIF